MSSIRIRKPKQPRKLTAVVMHSNHEKIDGIKGIYHRHIQPKPGVLFVGFVGEGGNVCLAYHGSDNVLYFLGTTQDGSTAMSSLDDGLEPLSIMAFDTQDLDAVAAEVADDLDLPDSMENWIKGKAA